MLYELFCYFNRIFFPFRKFKFVVFCYFIVILQVLQNIDDLFEREEFSAAHDAGWPDCFNSGVFVYRPSDKTYESLLQFALSQGSFDGIKKNLTLFLLNIFILREKKLSICCSGKAQIH